MPELPTWDERLMTLMRKPGQWITTDWSKNRMKVENARRRVLYLSAEREVSRQNIQTRIVDLDTGVHELQVRWVVREPKALGHPTVHPVVDTGNNPGWSSIHAVTAVVVTPAVVQRARSWRAGSDVILLSVESTRTMQLALPTSVAQYLRYCLNMIFGDPTEELTSVNDTTSNMTGTDIFVTANEAPEQQEQLT